MGQAQDDLSAPAPDGESAPDGADGAEREADRLAEKADAIREDLGGLVEELGQRRRAVAPRLRFIIPLAIVAGVGLAAAVRAWRRARKRRGRAALRSRRG